jgi:addiction module RelB/DinJ family antitoxin
VSIQVTARVDERKEKEFTEICDKLGLTVSSAINIFIQQVINHRGLPFEVKVPETLDEYVEHNKPWLDRALNQAQNGEFHILTEDELNAF